MVAGGQTTQLPLQAFYSQINRFLSGNTARGVLTSDSDLARVKVTRHDAVTGKTHEWIVDCSPQSSSDLWLRNGDVIEVPEKP